jgi:hypothetical protein
MSDVDHQCPYCELRFSYMAELKDHIVVDHVEHRSVVEDLDPHELPHIDARGLVGAAAAINGHQCPRCELRFAFTTELRQHVTLDHEDRGVVPGTR